MYLICNSIVHNNKRKHVIQHKKYCKIKQSLCLYVLFLLRQILLKYVVLIFLKWFFQVGTVENTKLQLYFSRRDGNLVHIFNTIMTVLFLKKIGSRMQSSDTKFSRRGGGVSYIDARKKRFQLASFRTCRTAIRQKNTPGNDTLKYRVSIKSLIL
jgi:hypothetical protein